MAASSVSTPMGRPSPEWPVASSPDSGIAWSCARPTSATSRPSRRRPASARSTAPSSTSGCSSYQLADTERGFGFRAGGPLDMRFDTSRGVPAAELLATLDAQRAGRPLRPLRRGAQGRSASPGPSSTPAGRRRSATAEELAALVERVAPPNPRQPRRTHPGDARLPGPADRGQRGARGPARGPRRRPGPAAARRSPGRPQLPLTGGPHRQALHRRRAAWLRLPARAPGLRLRPEPPTAPRDPAVAHPVGGRDRGQPTCPECPPAGRRAPGRLSRRAPAPIDPPTDGTEGGAPDEQAPPVQPPQVVRPPPARGS